MAENFIPAILKQKRNALNLTPEQVVQQLSERGFSISTKALYAYEAGTNLPKVPVFLALCDIYNIRDIMGSFGYRIPLCDSDNEWATDQYDDFFKASLYEKIYLLTKWGVPSFDGYQTYMTQRTQFVLSDQEVKFLTLFRQLDSRNQEAAFKVLEGLYSSQPGEEVVFTPKEA